MRWKFAFSECYRIIFIPLLFAASHALVQKNEKFRPHVECLNLYTFTLCGKRVISIISLFVLDETAWSSSRTAHWSGSLLQLLIIAPKSAVCTCSNERAALDCLVSYLAGHGLFLVPVGCDMPLRVRESDTDWGLLLNLNSLFEVRILYYFFF